MSLRWQIRRILKKGKGAVQYEEEIHFGETLTIGRAANQAIFVNDLRAALEHARVIALGGGKYRVESLVAAGVRIDGRYEQQAIVKAGAQLDIGTTRITFVPPGQDFEAAVEVASIDAKEIKARAASEALPQSLAEAGLSKRRPSWVLFLAALIVALVLPVATHFVPAFQGLTRHAPMLGLNAWDTGPVADVHHTFDKDCQSCHGKPFETVKDEKCLVCHDATKAHADPVRFPMFELADASCAYCHRDHNGNDGLIRADQVLCADCHRNLGERTRGDSKLPDVDDFGRNHPQFQVNLPAWDESGKFSPQRVSMDTAPLIEKSGLKFPHETHLRTRGLQGPDGVKVLGCADCHQPDPGGAGMQPVDFETMCQSCHRLDFDLRMPDRQVPHGRVPEVLYTLNDFYARVALEGGYDDVSAPVQVRQRRRPGQPSMTQDEQREALAWAQQKSAQVTETLFTGRACGVCHTVSSQPNSVEPWVVAPVRVAGVWFAKSRFTHAKHTTMNCVDCHVAEKSKSSADVLIPEISNCRTCHAGEHADDKLGSTCIACHGFHQAPMPHRVPTVAAAGGS